MAFRNMPNVAPTTAFGRALAAVNNTEFTADSSGPGGGGVRYLAVAAGPSQKHQAQRPGVDGKRDFPGTSRQAVILVGLPAGPEPNRVGSGAQREKCGRWASMAASHLGYKDGLPDDAPRPDGVKRAVIMGDKRFWIFDGCPVTLERFGVVVRSSHHTDGSKVTDTEVGAELPTGWVAEVGLDKPMVDGETYVVPCRYLRVLGNGQQAEWANRVLHAWAAAGQNAFGPTDDVLPFHPPVTNPDVDWTKVVPKRRDGASDAAAAADQGYQGDPSRPNKDKLSALGARGLSTKSRDASFRTLTLFSGNQANGTMRERDQRAGWTPVLTANMFFDYNNPEQFIKNTKDQPAKVAATKPQPPLNWHIEALSLMSVARFPNPVTVRVPTTIPSQLLHFFGISDPDMQIHARMFLRNGVYAIRVSPMINSFFVGEWRGEEFKISGYPRIQYLDKQPQWSTAQIFVDPLMTTLNTTLPVSRIVAMAAMVGLNMSPHTRNRARFGVQMGKVQNESMFKDTTGADIPPNMWARNINAANEELVSVLTECRRDIASAYPRHAFRVLIDGVSKDDPAIAALFEAAEGDAVTLLNNINNQVATIICERTNLSMVELNRLMAASIARVREECARAESWVDPDVAVPPQAEPGFFWPGDPGMKKPSASEADDYRAPTLGQMQKIYMATPIFEHVPRDQLCPTLARLVPEPNAGATVSTMRKPGKYDEDQPYRGVVVPIAIDADYATERGIEDLFSSSYDMHRVAFDAVDAEYEKVKGVMNWDDFEAHMAALNDDECERVAAQAEAAAAAAAATAATTTTAAAAGSVPMDTSAADAAAAAAAAPAGLKRTVSQALDEDDASSAAQRQCDYRDEEQDAEDYYEQEEQAATS